MGFVAVAKESAKFWDEYGITETKWSWWFVFGADAAALTIGMIGGGPVVACPLSAVISTSAAVR